MSNTRSRGKRLGIAAAVLAIGVLLAGGIVSARSSASNVALTSDISAPTLTASPEAGDSPSPTRTTLTTAPPEPSSTATSEPSDKPTPKQTLTVSTDEVQVTPGVTQEPPAPTPTHKKEPSVSTPATKPVSTPPATPKAKPTTKPTVKPFSPDWGGYVAPQYRFAGVSNCRIVSKSKGVVQYTANYEFYNGNMVADFGNGWRRYGPGDTAMVSITLNSDALGFLGDADIPIGYVDASYWATSFNYRDAPSPDAVPYRAIRPSFSEGTINPAKDCN